MIMALNKVLNRTDRRKSSSVLRTGKLIFRLFYVMGEINRSGGLGENCAVCA